MRNSGYTIVVSTHSPELIGIADVVYRIENKRLIVRALDPSALEIRFRNIQQPLLNRFDNAKQGLRDGICEKIKDLRTRIATCRTVLENASPQTIFNRGYSMVTDEKGNIIRNSAQVKSGEMLTITPSEGKIKAKVEETK